MTLRLVNYLNHARFGCDHLRCEQKSALLSVGHLRDGISKAETFDYSIKRGPVRECYLNEQAGLFEHSVDANERRRLDLLANLIRRGSALRQFGDTSVAFIDPCEKIEENDASALCVRVIEPPRLLLQAPVTEIDIDSLTLGRRYVRSGVLKPNSTVSDEALNVRWS